jgi:hypothetical protein
VNDFIRTPACLPVEGAGGSYAHWFGGELETPVIPPGGNAPCHLLYTIDTEDPLFPIRIPGTRFLPLIYCQQYNAAAMSYRVENGKIAVDWIESSEWDPDFPYDSYPRAFARRQINLMPADPEALRLLELADEDNGTNESRFGGWHRLCQGSPSVECESPRCGGGSMNVFGVIYQSPVKGVRLWDPDSDSSDVEIIYQICSSCSSIQACNRCT